jgi:hypothetical protein
VIYYKYDMKGNTMFYERSSASRDVSTRMGPQESSRPRSGRVHDFAVRQETYAVAVPENYYYQEEKLIKNPERRREAINHRNVIAEEERR